MGYFALKKQESEKSSHVFRQRQTDLFHVGADLHRSSKGENLERKRDDRKHAKPAMSHKPGCFKGHNFIDAKKKSQTGKPHRYKAVRCFESRGRVHCCPWSISVSKITGNIALADYYNHRVQLMDSDWNFVGTDRGRESWWRENR